MKQKIFVLVVILVMIISSIVINSSILEVEATPGGREDDGIGLDYDYIWEQTVNFSNIIYKYPDSMIPKGRSFGSWGGNYAIFNITMPSMDSMGLWDVHKEQIKHIEGSNKNYTSIVNMTDFDLKINNASDKPYPYPNPVPKTEMYVIPNAFPYNDLGKLTGNNTVNSAKIVQNNMTNFINLWPLAGTYNDYHFNITKTNYDDLNDITGLIIIGNLTYLEPEDPIPSKESQYGRVYLLDDADGCQEKLDNITRATASIIIDPGTKGMEYANATKCHFSVVSISDSDGIILKELLENYTVLVDNVTGNLTFTYNLGVGWWPTTEHVYIDRIPDHYELANITWVEGQLIKFIAIISGRNEPAFVDYLACVNAKSIFWRMINFFRPFKQCKGIILFDSYDYHFMICTFNYWRGESFDEYTFIEQANYGPSLPIFTLNYSVGNWLLNNRTTTTLDGYADQELTVETPTSPGLEAYNVIGNITIDENPDDKIAIISNRYDGMWGQTPGDSGVGGGIVLGIAKYMKDYNIKPKYNLTFLFTTGEEYIYRGAYHYNDSHQNDTIKYWLILDQLCFDQTDQPLTLHYKNDSHGDILNEIFKNQTQYWARTGYENVTDKSVGGGSEQEVASSRPECNSFCIVKGVNYNWDHWHRAGMNYTEGDSLNNIDRNDVNVTAELTWNITKYFIVNPDCWFENYTFTPFDSPDDGDVLEDSINVTFTIKTCLPHDLVMVNVSLNNTREIVANKKINYTVIPDGINGTIILTVPKDEKERLYTCIIYLYNSTGRINEIIELDVEGDKYNDTIQSSEYLHPYQPSVPFPWVILIVIIVILVTVILLMYYYKKKKYA